MKIQTTRIFEEINNAKSRGFAVCSEQGSSRSSKTYNTLIWLIHYAMSHANTSISICRATLPALKASVLRDFVEIMQRIDQFEVRRLNKSELIYSFPNGSWVEFFSCDSEQKLRGRKRAILYVNEANEIRLIDWTQLQLRTTEFTVIDYNPSFSDEHWICEVNRDPRTYHFITTYKDNPFLEPKVVEEIESLRHKNKSLWQVYGLGLQAAIEGLIFPEVEVVDEFPAMETEYCGLDFGFTQDPTAFVRVGWKNNTLYLDELFYATQMTTADIIREIKACRMSRAKIIADSAEQRLIAEIYNAGINIHAVKKYPDSIIVGLTKMKEFRICVTRRSSNVLKELKNYTYAQDREGKWLNSPIDKFNHAVDAVRYVVMNEILGGKTFGSQKQMLDQMLNDML